MNKRWHLTPEELEQIRELALNRFSNTAIATQMRITRNSVALAKLKNGFACLASTAGSRNIGTFAQWPDCTSHRQNTGGFYPWYCRASASARIYSGAL